MEKQTYIVGKSFHTMNTVHEEMRDEILSEIGDSETLPKTHVVTEEAPNRAALLHKQRTD